MPLSVEEVADRTGDFGGMGLQGEVTGVEEAHLGRRDVTLERFRAWRKEERVVLAPDREQARRVLTEVFLERGVKRDVALVVAEQVQLDFIGARTGKVVIVQGDTIR